MNRLKMILAVVGVVVVVALAWRSTRASGSSTDLPVEREWKPIGRVVTVEVFNGGGTPGAARDAALKLRRARLDVVNWGNAPAALVDTSTEVVRVLVRRGDTTGVGRVGEALGAIEVIDRPDPRRLVDLTVVVPRRIREP